MPTPQLTSSTARGTGCSSGGTGTAGGLATACAPSIPRARGCLGPPYAQCQPVAPQLIGRDPLVASGLGDSLLLQSLSWQPTSVSARPPITNGSTKFEVPVR